MKGSAPLAPTSSAVAITPASCPSCQSSLIVTTAKRPDADSYRRGTRCEEVWNAARAQPDWHRGRRRQ